MTTITEASTQSLNYPGPPLNTPAIASLAGDATSPVAADLETLTQRLSIARTPPSTPPFDNGARNDSSSTLTDFNEGKYAAGESTPSTPRALALPKLKVTSNHYAERFGAVTTPGSLRQVNSTASTAANEPPTFEYSAWAVVAEEDTMRALQRMAMLARDEHAHDQSRTVQQHYSARLAKLIGEAEIQFDAEQLK